MLLVLSMAMADEPGADPVHTILDHLPAVCPWGKVVLPEGVRMPAGSTPLVHGSPVGARHITRLDSLGIHTYTDALLLVPGVVSSPSGPAFPGGTPSLYVDGIRWR